ncbi:hypothetical protein ACFV0T_28670 [Streptomyces sp. NPDC059582]|uniref:hypothetical protein n=1 Tax=Streptomyces sp. NPDC059582 TaxID=3346875 RepID=UPI00367B1441
MSYGTAPAPSSSAPAPPAPSHSASNAAVSASNAAVSASKTASASKSASASASTSASASASLSASASASASPTEPDRAGSQAGEGRQRPGRREDIAAQVQGEGTEEDPAYPDGTNEGESTDEDSGSASDSPDAGQATRTPGQDGLAPATPTDEPGRQTVARPQGAAEPVLQILPLGSGLVLIGLGLGLAFLGLRLRRG